MESRGEVALARRGSGCGRRLVNSSIENAWDFSLLCLTRSLVHPSLPPLVTLVPMFHG